MSAYLSAADRVANTARGKATNEIKRQSKRQISMVNAGVDAWTPKPQAKAQPARKRRLGDFSAATNRLASSREAYPAWFGLRHAPAQDLHPTHPSLSRPVEDCGRRPALAGIRDECLDDPSPSRPDSRCIFGDGRSRACRAAAARGACVAPSSVACKRRR